MTSPPFNESTRDEVQRQLKELKDDELVDFIRDTIVRLDALADRLDVVADKKEDKGNA